MKKIFFRALLIFGILITISNVLNVRVHAEDNSTGKKATQSLPPSDTKQPKSGGSTPISGVGSKNCKTMLGEATKKQKKKTPKVNDDDIIVILTESITKNDSKYSCGEIVSCLRKVNKGKPGSEMLVTKALKENYSFCIVSGKDGLDLLSNYANLVYTWIAGIVGAISVLVIILSGIQISIGGLSQEEVSTAKDRVTRALVGLVVLFLSAFILYTINPFFFT